MSAGMALLCLIIGVAWTFVMVPILSLCVNWWTTALFGKKK